MKNLNYLIVSFFLLTGCAEEPSNPKSTGRDVTAEVSDLADNSSKAADELSDAQKEVGKVNEEIALLEEQSAERSEILEAELADKNLLLQGTSTEMARIQTQLNNQRNQNSNQANALREELEKLEEEKTKWEAEVQKTDKDLRNADDSKDKELEELMGKIAAATAEVDRLNAKCAKLQSENEYLNQLKIGSLD